MNPNGKNRKQNRWEIFDYSSEGAYFVTLCSYKRELFFGNIENKKMYLNELGLIVDNFWKDVPKQYPEIALDEYQLMPNHFHGILTITRSGANSGTIPVGTIHEFSLRNSLFKKDTSLTATEYQKHRRNMLISKAIGYFKMNAAKAINLARDTKGATVWHRSFHDRVIRNYEEYCRIRGYIISNPANWKEDENNPANITLKEKNIDNGDC